jgi:hypothetical protein
MKAPYIRAFVRLALAAISVLENRQDLARDQLAGAIGDADACKMAGVAALARMRMAQLAGDAAALEEACEALAGCAVVDGGRFARVFATWP